MDDPRLITETGLEARIAALAEPVCEGFGFRLVRVRLSGREGLTVQVMIDRAVGNVGVDDCATVSRDLAAVLDVEDPIDRPYQLEVSTAGVDRVLVRAGDFLAAEGKEIRIEMTRLFNERRRFRGIVTGFEAGSVILDMTSPEGEATTVALPATDVAEARLVMTDALIRDSLRADKKARAAAE